MKNKPVAVVGAGISGLTISTILKKREVPVEIFEKKDEPGGALKTVNSNGWLLEYGPNTLLLKDKIVADFLRDAGLEEEMVVANENSSKRFIVKNGKPEPLPASIWSAVNTPLFSLKGKLRILGEPFISRSDDPDQTVAEFVERRLGEEVLNYAINPFVAGIFANRPEDLSLRHAFPAMHNLEAEYGSMIWGSFAGAKKRKEQGRIPRKLISFKEGIQQLPETLASQAGKAHYNQKIEKIEKRTGGWFLESNGREFGPYSKVVLNTPLYQIKQSQIPVNDYDFEMLQKVHYPPLSVMYLGFKKDQVEHPLDGFGFLVPELEQRNILGALFSSTLFEGRAPDDRHLLTVFVGGGRQPDHASLPTEKMLNLVMADLQDLLGITGEPVFMDHVYWPNAIPAYHTGYDDILRTLKNVEARNPGLHLAGNFRHGISVPDCIKSGIELADQIAKDLS